MGLELWWQDEMRLGQKNGRVRQWARKGTRPRQRSMIYAVGISRRFLAQAVEKLAFVPDGQ